MFMKLMKYKHYSGSNKFQGKNITQTKFTIGPMIYVDVMIFYILERNGLAIYCQPDRLSTDQVLKREYISERVHSQ